MPRGFRRLLGLAFGSRLPHLTIVVDSIAVQAWKCSFYSLVRKIFTRISDIQTVQLLTDKVLW